MPKRIPTAKRARRRRTRSLSASTLERFRDALLKKRDDLLNVIQRKKEQAIPPQETVGDEADIASQSIEKELLFDVTDQEQLVLDDIEAALRKMERGGFGNCESCQNPIPQMRLRFMPWARYCIACQSKNERPGS